MITTDDASAASAPAESEKDSGRFGFLGGDATPHVARIKDLEKQVADLRAERAEREAGMIQRTGQRFLAQNGEVMVVVSCDPKSTRTYWRLRSEESGTDLTYTSDGKTLFGNVAGDYLVGPAPDELAEAKAEAHRYLAELKATKRERDQFRAALGESLSRSTLKAMTPEAYVQIVENSEDLFSGDDLRQSIEIAIRDTYRFDPRTGEEGFGPSMEPQLFVAFQTQQADNYAVDRLNGIAEADFTVTRVEFEDRSAVRYCIERA